MKKLIMIMLVAVGMNLFADEWHDESTGFTWYYTISGDSATLTGCSPKEGQLPPLPSILGGKIVKVIEGYAFRGCSGFTGSLTIPDSVTTIGNSAFRGCSGFTGSLTMGDSVTTIGAFAFENCKQITSVRVSESVTNIGDSAFLNCIGISKVLFPERVKDLIIGDKTFGFCIGLTDGLIFPKGTRSINPRAVWGCSNLEKIVFPETLEPITFWVNPFGEYYDTREDYLQPTRLVSLREMIFLGLPPSAKVNVDYNYSVMSAILRFAKMYNWRVMFTEKFAAEWKLSSGIADCQSVYREGWATVEIISSKMRESDPTIMDVVYKVTSTKPTVKVRALAFQDGERSFAKVVRPETFVEDENGNLTAGNIGDGVTANEEHTLSWKVSADWNATLAKVKFEVLAVEDEILPLELVTLPKTETHPKMVFSWNYVIPSRAFDALLWLYADKDLGLTLTDGVLKNGTVRLADGASCDKTSYDALVYIYGKMGYELLQGERLDYVRERSRLDLPGISERQYAVKVIEE